MIPALGQEDHCKSEVTPGYRVRPCFRKQNEIKPGLGLGGALAQHQGGRGWRMNLSYKASLGSS